MPRYSFQREDGTWAVAEGESRSEALANARRAELNIQRNADSDVAGDIGDQLSSGATGGIGGLLRILPSLPRMMASGATPSAIADNIRSAIPSGWLGSMNEQERALYDLRQEAARQGSSWFEDPLNNLLDPLASAAERQTQRERLSLSEESERRAQGASEYSDRLFAGDFRAPSGGEALGLAEQGIASLPGMAAGVGASLLTRSPIAGAAVEGAISAGQSTEGINEAVAEIAYSTPEVFRNSDIGRRAIAQAGGDYDRAVEIATREVQEIAPTIGLSTAALSAVGGSWVDRLGLVKRSVLGAFLREGSEEALQSGAEVALQNRAMQGVDPSIQVTDGVRAAMTQGAILGGTMGGIGGGISNILGHDPGAATATPPPAPPVPPPAPPPVPPTPSMTPAAIAAATALPTPGAPPAPPTPPPAPAPAPTPTDVGPAFEPPPGPPPRSLGELLAEVGEPEEFDTDPIARAAARGPIEASAASLADTSGPLFPLGIVNPNGVPNDPAAGVARDEVVVPLYRPPADYNPLAAGDGETIASTLLGLQGLGVDPETTPLGATIAAANGLYYFEPEDVPPGSTVAGSARLLLDEDQNGEVSAHLVPMDWQSQIPINNTSTDPRLTGAAPVQGQAPAPVAQQATPAEPVQEPAAPVQEQEQARTTPAPEPATRGPRVKPKRVRNAVDKVDDSSPSARAYVEEVRQEVIARRDRGEALTGQEEKLLALTEPTDEIPEFTPPASANLGTAKTKPSQLELNAKVADKTQIVDTGYAKLKARKGKDRILTNDDGSAHSVVTPEVFDLTYETLPSGKVRARAGREVPYFIAPEDMTIPSKEGPVKVKAGDPVIQGPAGEWYPPGGMAKFLGKYEIQEETKAEPEKPAEPKATPKTESLAEKRKAQLDKSPEAEARRAAAAKSLQDSAKARAETNKAREAELSAAIKLARGREDVSRQNELETELEAVRQEQAAQEENSNVVERLADAGVAEEDLAFIQEQLEQSAKLRAEAEAEEARRRKMTREQLGDEAKKKVEGWKAKRAEIRANREALADEALEEDSRRAAEFDEENAAFEEEQAANAAKKLEQEQKVAAAEWDAELKPIVDKLINEEPLTKEDVTTGRRWKSERLNGQGLGTMEKKFSNLQTDFNEAAAALRASRQARSATEEAKPTKDAAGFDVVPEDKTPVTKPTDTEIAEAQAEKAKRRNDAAILRAFSNKARAMFGPGKAGDSKARLARYANVEAAIYQFDRFLEVEDDLPEVIVSNYDLIVKAIARDWANAAERSSLGDAVYNGEQLPTSDPEWVSEMQKAILAAAECAASSAGAIGLAATVAAPAAVAAGAATALASPVIGAGIGAGILAERENQVIRERMREAEALVGDQPRQSLDEVIANAEAIPWSPPLDFDPEVGYDESGNAFTFRRSRGDPYTTVYQDGRPVDSVYEPPGAGLENRSEDEDDALMRAVRGESVPDVIPFNPAPRGTQGRDITRPSP